MEYTIIGYYVLGDIDGEAKPKISFPFLFPLRGGGVGGGDAGKMQGNFLVFAHASPRACPRRIGSHHHAIGAYEAVSSHHARGACEVGSRKG